MGSVPENLVERAVGENIAAAPLHLFPYPYIYVQGVFPPGFYGDIQRHLPPSDVHHQLRSEERREVLGTRSRGGARTAG